MVCLGCNSLVGPTRRPYQETPAFRCMLCAAYNQTIRPPQQNPVMPSLSTLPAPDALAQATVASRSSITCASVTLVTTADRISFTSDIFETSPWHANSSGEIARYPNW